METLRSRGNLYYGKVYLSSFGAEPFFAVSRSLFVDDVAVSILEVSVLPSNFSRFYSALANAYGQQYALLRDNGTFLARYATINLGRRRQWGSSQF